jgi:hypothetical protein
MKQSKQNKEYLLNFLMKSNSLHDLLEILANVCENLDLDYLNPRIKHFKYFQFTFFGLMARAKSLLEIMIFRAEVLKKDFKEFDEIHSKLMRLRKNIELAYDSIHKNKMLEGKKKIIESNKEYSETFEKIMKMCQKMI